MGYRVTIPLPVDAPTRAHREMERQFEQEPFGGYTRTDGRGAWVPDSGDEAIHEDVYVYTSIVDDEKSEVVAAARDISQAVKHHTDEDAIMWQVDENVSFGFV